MAVKEETYSPQRLPVSFPGSARFQDANGQPSGAVGAQATVTISINLRPQFVTGIRIHNVYPIPAGLQNVDQLTYLERLDEEQTMTTELTQSNIIVRAVLQTLFVGRGGIHWHPLPVPYPWGGGNNITLVITRLTAYPDGILPTCHVALEGVTYVKDSGTEGRIG